MAPWSFAATLVVVASVLFGGARAATLAESLVAHDVLLLNPRELTVFFLVVTVLSAATNFAMAQVQVRSSSTTTRSRASAVGGMAHVAHLLMKSVSSVVLRVGVAMGAAFIVTEVASAAAVSWKVVVTLTYVSFVITFFMMIAIAGVIVHIAGAFAVTSIIRHHEHRQLIAGRGLRDSTPRERRDSWSVATRIRHELLMSCAAAFPADAMTVLTAGEPGIVPDTARDALSRAAHDDVRRLALERQQELKQRALYEAEVRQKRAALWDEYGGEEAGVPLSAIIIGMLPALLAKAAQRKLDARKPARSTNAPVVLSYREESAIEQAAADHALRMDAFAKREQHATEALETAALLREVTLGHYLDAVLVDPDHTDNLAVRASSWAVLVPFAILIALRQVTSLSEADDVEHPLLNGALLVGIFGGLPAVIHVGVFVATLQSLWVYAEDLCYMDRQVSTGRRAKLQSKARAMSRVVGSSHRSDTSSAASSNGSFDAPLTAPVATAREAQLDVRATLHQLYAESTAPDGLRTRRNPVQYVPFQMSRGLERIGQACFICELFYAAVVAVEFGNDPVNAPRSTTVLVGCAFVPVAMAVAIQPCLTVLFALTSRMGSQVLHRAAYHTVIVPCATREKWALEHPDARQPPRVLVVPVRPPPTPSETTRTTAAPSEITRTSDANTTASAMTFVTESRDAGEATATAAGTATVRSASLAAEMPGAANSLDVSAAHRGASSPHHETFAPTNPLLSTDQSASVEGRKRVGFYFGDPRDAALHGHVPGSGVNLPGDRGHHGAKVGSGAVDAFHDYVALEQQRRAMDVLERRVRGLVKQLKGERKYTEELQRRTGVVKGILVGRRKLRGRVEDRAHEQPIAAEAEVHEEDLQWCVRPVEATLEHLALVAAGEADDEEWGGAADAGTGDREARRQRARRDRDRQEIRKLLPLYTPQGAFELSAEGAALYPQPALVRVPETPRLPADTGSGVSGGRGGPSTATVLTPPSRGTDRKRGGSVRFAGTTSTVTLDDDPDL
jgi:hypothetical protein